MPHRLRFLLLGVLLLAGCSLDDDQIRIRIWHQKQPGAERDVLQKAVARYNAAHPNVRVETLYRETEELRNLFVVGSVGGQGPELIYGPADNVSILAITESIMPLDGVLPDSFLARFDDNGIIHWDGKPWMVADQLGNHLTFVYNKALIEEPPKTLDEFVQMLREQTVDDNGDGRPDRYGLVWNYREPFFFIPFLTCFGGWVMDDEGHPTLDTEATVKAIRFILDLRDKYHVIPNESDLEVANALFIEGRAASVINGPWSWASYGEAGVDYGIARIPFNTETGQWCAPMVSAKGYSVNINTPAEKLPYVRDVLMYLTGAEIQAEMAERLATIPVIKSVRDAPVIQQNALLQASLRQVEVGRMMPIAPQMRQIWDGMRGPYQLVMNGAVTPEEGARLMQEQTEKLIKDTFL